MALSTIRRAFSIISALLVIGSLLILAGTFYTADHFSILSVSNQRLATPQGYTMKVIFDIKNTGLFDVAIDLTGKILSSSNIVVQNSTAPTWVIPANAGGNYSFTLFIDSATAATYFSSSSPQPVLDFAVLGTTAYSLVSVSITGQRNLNITGG